MLPCFRGKLISLFHWNIFSCSRNCWMIHFHWHLTVCLDLVEGDVLWAMKSKSKTPKCVIEKHSKMKYVAYSVTIFNFAPKICTCKYHRLYHISVFVFTIGLEYLFIVIYLSLCNLFTSEIRNHVCLCALRLNFYIFTYMPIEMCEVQKQEKKNKESLK